MKKLPIARTIASVIAGGLIIAGGFFLIEAYRLRQEFDRHIQARPLDLKVDLSQPGKFNGEFHQTWRACHSQTINLHVPANVIAKIPPSDLLAPLDFKWQITDSDGRVIVDNEFSGRLDWTDRFDGEAITLAYFRPFDLGTYTFGFTVITGAPQLAGIPQRLVSEYQACGLELLPVFFTRALGIIALVVASIILLVIRSITKRKQKAIRQQNDGQPSSASIISDELPS